MNKYIIGVIVLIAIAVARIAATYAVFNGAYDEPFHIAEVQCVDEFVPQRSANIAGHKATLGVVVHAAHRIVAIKELV